MELTSTGNIDQGHIVYYRANKKDCSACLLKPRCATAAMRKVTRDINEDVRDRARALADTEAFQQSRQERKKVEMRFAHMKRILRLDRFRLRGLSGVRDEVLLTATAKPQAARQASLPCPATFGKGLPCVGVASSSTAPTPGSATNEPPALKTEPCDRDQKSFATQSPYKRTFHKHLCRERPLCPRKRPFTQSRYFLR